MYKQIQIEFEPAFVPAIGNIETYPFNSSTYYIRGIFSRGRMEVNTFYFRLATMEFENKIRLLRTFCSFDSNGIMGRDFVFVFDAPSCQDVMKMIVALNEACVSNKISPLPDLEFVHPAAHALLYSLGGFSGDYADSYLLADPGAVDLNRKVR
jgi:hypothetical protein